jgi:hypothetical protein
MFLRVVAGKLSPACTGQFSSRIKVPSPDTIKSRGSILVHWAGGDRLTQIATVCYMSYDCLHEKSNHRAARTPQSIGRSTSRGRGRTNDHCEPKRYTGRRTATHCATWLCASHNHRRTQCWFLLAGERDSYRLPIGLSSKDFWESSEFHYHQKCHRKGIPRFQAMNT